MSASFRPTGTLRFASAEEAWFWTIAALRGRREHTGAGDARIARPCDPDDIMLCVDRLFRRQILSLSHARVLRVWGERQQAPYGTTPATMDATLWREALARLTPALRQKGIVC